MVGYPTLPYNLAKPSRHYHITALNIHPVHSYNFDTTHITKQQPMSSPKITWMLLSTDVSDQPSNLPSLTVADHICTFTKLSQKPAVIYTWSSRPIHIGLLCSRRPNKETEPTRWRTNQALLSVFHHISAALPSQARSFVAWPACYRAMLVAAPPGPALEPPPCCCSRK